MPRGGPQPGSGNPGYGKSKKIVEMLDKYSELYWDTLGDMMRGDDKTDRKFAMSEYSKHNIRRMPNIVSGDEDGAPIKVQLVNYGDDTSQLSAKEIPATIPQSDGQGDEESGISLA